MYDKIKNVAIIGTGIMGREIAQVVLMGGYNVHLYDVNEKMTEKALLFLEKSFRSLETKNRLPQGISTNQLLERIQKSSIINNAVKNADLVIEAIPENMKLKQQLFEKLSNIVSEHTILASNTSNMPITEIALKSTKPERIVGMHFFIPIILLQAIELIKGKKTSKDTFKVGDRFLKSLPCLRGKRKIIKIEKERPGFVINRITAASSIYLNWLLNECEKKEGLSYEMVDADIVALQGGLGPYAKWDYLGLDVIYASFNYFAEELSKDFTPAKKLKQLVQQGDLGRKTGKGFYKWTANEKPLMDLEEKADLFDLEIFMAIQLNEACRLLEENVMDTYKEIDKAVVAGMNMPGPFSMGKRKFKEWSALLESFSKTSDLAYLKPCKTLKEGLFLEKK
ncbi:MAG: putative 3-hydroxybutyryl-CoA dehydrogenase [Promethearchaeota archaeon]|nr:MAG: putative 3-hydroxybutyryl-CoA dehydrogenase [Candidatus Lokiarchaeota archaeon]